MFCHENLWLSICLVPVVTVIWEEFCFWKISLLEHKHDKFLKSTFSNAKLHLCIFFAIWEFENCTCSSYMLTGHSPNSIGSCMPVVRCALTCVNFYASTWTRQRTCIYLCSSLHHCSRLQWLTVLLLSVAYILARGRATSNKLWLLWALIQCSFQHSIKLHWTR